MDIWQELGIAPTTDQREIKRAYARRLRIVHPEDDPEGFQRLRQAYELALDASHFEYRAELDVYAADAALASERPADSTPVVPIEHGQNQDRASAGETIVEPRKIALEYREPLHAPADAENTAEPRKLAREYLESVRLNPGSAAAKLRAVLQRPEIESFAARERFEVELLAGIFENKQLPVADVAAIAAELRWTEDSVHLYSIDTRMAAQVLARVQADRDFTELKGAAQRESAAARILTSPFNPRSYRTAALRRRVVSEMREMLRMIQWGKPELAEYGIDPRIIEWWNAKTSTANFYWSHLVFALIFLLIVGAVFGPYDKPPVGFNCNSIQDQKACEDLRTFFFLSLNTIVGLTLARLYEVGQLRWYASWRNVLTQASHSKIGRLLQGPPFRLGWIPVSLLVLILNRPLLALAPWSEWLLIILTGLTAVWVAGAGQALSKFELHSIIALFAMIIGGLAAEPMMGGAYLLAIPTAALAILVVIFGKFLFPMLVEDKFGSHALVAYRYGWLGVFAVLITIVILVTPDSAASIAVMETALILVILWSHLATRYDVLDINAYVGVLLITLTFGCGTIIVRAIGITKWGEASILCAWIISTGLHFGMNHLKKNRTSG